jgi:polyisoprenoid-binding protein YceI
MKPQIGALALFFLGSVLVGLPGCDTNPTKDKEMAEAAAPVEEAPTPQQAESARTISVSQKDGSLGFVGAKVTDKHEGRFETFEGEISVPKEALEKGRVRLQIDVSSLAVEPAKLKKHLLGADFFDVEKFPQATFVSTTVAPAEGGKYLVTGNLELHGQKKSIRFPAEIVEKDGQLVVKAEFGINRKDFGIVYPGMSDDLIKDEVLIKIDLAPKIQP